MLLPIDRENFISTLTSPERPWQEAYLTMYSSQWQGYVKDPALMLVPIDDHLVHRGDGVFDTMRCVGGKVYQMDAHLARLEKSAKAISLTLPAEYDRIREIIDVLVTQGGEKDCIIRIILSRGPGSFSTNPYDCPRSQLYINVVRFKKLPDALYRDGIAIITSRIPIKKAFFATIKSCNYLPNVLIKKQAVEAGYRYAVTVDEDGFLAEGSTENIGILSGDGILKFPGFDKTLAGTTVSRVFELAGTLEKQGLIAGRRFSKISPEEAYHAKEVMLLGTSINVLPVVKFDGRPIGEGFPGPVNRALSALLWDDMTGNPSQLTNISWGEKPRKETIRKRR